METRIEVEPNIICRFKSTLYTNQKFVSTTEYLLDTIKYQNSTKNFLEYNII